MSTPDERTTPKFFAGSDKYEGFLEQRRRTPSEPQRVDIDPGSVLEPPFGDMVVIAFKWTLAFAFAWVAIVIPIGIIWYLLTR